MERSRRATSVQSIQEGSSHSILVAWRRVGVELGMSKYKAYSAWDGKDFLERALLMLCSEFHRAVAGERRDNMSLALSKRTMRPWQDTTLQGDGNSEVLGL